MVAGGLMRRVGVPNNSDIGMTAQFDFQPFTDSIGGVQVLREQIWAPQQFHDRDLAPLMGSLGAGNKKVAYHHLSKLVGSFYARRVAELVASGEAGRPRAQVWLAACAIAGAMAPDATAARVSLDLWGAAAQGIALPEWFLDLAGRV